MGNPYKNVSQLEKCFTVRKMFKKKCVTANKMCKMCYSWRLEQNSKSHLENWVTVRKMCHS